MSSQASVELINAVRAARTAEQSEKNSDGLHKSDPLNMAIVGGFALAVAKAKVWMRLVSSAREPLRLNFGLVSDQLLILVMLALHSYPVFSHPLNKGSAPCLPAFE